VAKKSVRRDALTASPLHSTSELLTSRSAVYQAARRQRPGPRIRFGSLNWANAPAGPITTGGRGHELTIAACWRMRKYTAGLANPDVGVYYWVNRLQREAQTPLFVGARWAPGRVNQPSRRTAARGAGGARGGALSPVLAAILHNASSVALVANSSRLIRFDIVENPGAGDVLSRAE
jgi:hypothetical protein